MEQQISYICRSGQASTSPRMNFSTFSRASSSKYWTGGDFMKYEVRPH